MEESPLPRPGAGFRRAAWNIAFLKLDRGSAPARRHELLEFVDACERALAKIAGTPDPDARAELERIIVKVVDHVARRRLFLRVFGIEVSSGLERRLDEAEARLRGT